MIDEFSINLGFIATIDENVSDRLVYKAKHKLGFEIIADFCTYLWYKKYDVRDVQTNQGEMVVRFICTKADINKALTMMNEMLSFVCTSVITYISEKYKIQGEEDLFLKYLDCKYEYLSKLDREYKKMFEESF